jgi:uncharacterized membrane protein YagU involved in acid resistance
MSTLRNTATEETTSVVQKGVLAGLAGGLVFGAMMAMQGVLPMVGMLVRVESALVGFIVHMLISAFAGAIFGVLAARLPAGWGPALGAGAVYGVIWWVVGALILMPLMLGMSEMVFQVGEMQWMSLLGHLVFGLITAAVFVLLVRRS